MASQNLISTPVRQYSSVKVEVTEYDSETGLPLKTLSSLNFGSAQLNNFTSPMVIKMNVAGVRKISNIKLCVLSSSQTIESSGTKNSDNTSPDGNFGIEHELNFSQKSSLSTFFSGVNPTGDPSSYNNVLIKNVSDTQSEFIYLTVKSPDSVNRGSLYFKWFFEFS